MIAGRFPRSDSAWLSGEVTQSRTQVRKPALHPPTASPTAGAASARPREPGPRRTAGRRATVRRRSWTRTWRTLSARQTRRVSQSPLLASTPRVVDEDAPTAVRRAAEDVCAVAVHLDRTAVGLRALELPAVVDEGHVAGGQDVGDLAAQPRLQRRELLERVSEPPGPSLPHRAGARTPPPTRKG